MTNEKFNESGNSVSYKFSYITKFATMKLEDEEGKYETSKCSTRDRTFSKSYYMMWVNLKEKLNRKVRNKLLQKQLNLIKNL